MAKISQVLARVDEARPNAFDPSLKVKWLATLDGRVAADIYRLQHSELAQFCYDGTDQEIELLVPFPHDDIYDLWLIAQIDMANGEYNKYQNSMIAYNAAFDSFVHWFCSTYDPAQGFDDCCCSCGYRPPYFLTAYGLAVKAGFRGTEEQWLESLIGQKGTPGDRVQLQYANEKIQWRYITGDGEDASRWTDLMSVSALRDQIAVKDGLTSEQVTALDELFRIAVFTEDASVKYAAFRQAFGLDEPSEPDTPDVPEHTHSYTSSVTKAATCDTAGVRTYTCSCGHSYTQSIPATGHNYVDGVCTKCGAVDPNYEEPDVPGDTSEPVYQLAEPAVFDGTNHIDTGYTLLDEDKSWSVCVDFAGNPGGVVWDASPNASQGLALAGGSYYRALVSLDANVRVSAGSTANHKVIATHVKGTTSIMCHYLVEGGSYTAAELVKDDYLTNKNIFTVSPRTVTIGSNCEGAHNFTGTVNGFEIYERVISQDEINAYMGVTA